MIVNKESKADSTTKLLEPDRQFSKIHGFIYD